MDNTALGFMLVLVSSVLYGCEYVPIKMHEMHDGMFVQWLKCSGVLFAGTVINIVRGFPPYNSLCALGGLIWSTSNACVVPIMQLSGPLGILVWVTVATVFGWATPRFGMFGLTAEVPENVAENVVEYMGVVLTIGSAFIFAFAKPSPPPEKHEPNEHQFQFLKRALMPTAQLSTISGGLMMTDGFYIQTSNVEFNPSKSFWENNKKRIAGLLLALPAAFLSSQGFTPLTMVQQEYAAAHNGTVAMGFDYSYSFASGAIFGGTFYFLVYCIVMRNGPQLNARVALPGIVYGFIWAAAFFTQVYGNGLLSQSIVFPICARLPSCVMLLWDIFFFKQIRGKRNLIILGVGVVVSILGVILIALADLL